MDSILLTGYEPFADWKVNPTEIAVREISGREYHGYQIKGSVLKLQFHTIREELTNLVGKYNPKAIILSGQAGGHQIRLEQKAVNLANPRVPYNCGIHPKEKILVELAPEFQTSSLPLDTYFTKLEEGEIPVRYSDDAGTFGCNQVFYYARNDFAEIPSGFIHVPLLPNQTEKDEWMSQDTITKALDLICETTAKWLQTKK